ncbi:unnamed protein product, partial [Ixodes pacificus]
MSLPLVVESIRCAKVKSGGLFGRSTCRAYDRELCLLHEDLQNCAVTWEVTMHLTMASITWISCWTEEQPGRPALFKPVASSSERRCDIWTACIQSGQVNKPFYFE